MLVVVTIERLKTREQILYLISGGKPFEIDFKVDKPSKIYTNYGGDLKRGCLMMNLSQHLSTSL